MVLTAPLPSRFAIPQAHRDAAHRSIGVEWLNSFYHRIILLTMIRIPSLIPGLRLATLSTLLLSLFWISLEGALWREALLAALISLVLIGRFWQRPGEDRVFQRAGVWLAAAALSGLALGAISASLMLLLMSIKTGLHAHGPEFTQAELDWALRQPPYWTAAGLCFGLGVGMLILAFVRRRPGPK